MLIAALLVCLGALAHGPAQPARSSVAVRLGGIATGWIEWRGADGFGSSALSQNQDCPASALNGSFMAVWTSAQGRSSARVLATSNAYGLPCSARLAAEHRFPFASLSCLDDDLPVAVSVQLFAPVIPYDVSTSCLPAIPIVFTVRNVSRAPVRAAVAVSWETVLGIGGAADLGPFSNQSGITARVLPASGGVAGIAFSGPALEDKRVADLRMHNTRGTQALLARFPSPEADVTTCMWNPTASQPEWWAEFASSGSVASKDRARPTSGDCLAGAVAVRLDLKANETREVPFVVAWHSPRIYDRHGSDLKPLYAVRFADAETVGRFALEDRAALRALSEEWQARMMRSIAGQSALDRLASELEQAVCATRWVSQGEDEPASAAVVGLENAAADVAVPKPRRMGVQSALLALFPSLDAADIEWRLAAAVARSLFGEPDDQATIDLVTLASRHTASTGNRAWLMAIWSGLRDVALRALTRIADRGGLSGDVVSDMLDLASFANDSETAAQCAELRTRTTSRTEHPPPVTSAWADWARLIGCAWSAERLELTLEPQLPPAQTRLSGPVFLPGHWMWCEWRQLPSRTTVDVRLDRVMPLPAAHRRTAQKSVQTTPLGIRRLALRLPRKHALDDVRVTVGTAPTAAVARADADGRVILELEPATALRPGDRLTVELMLER